MDEHDPPQHKPGDVVNGYVLTKDGQWVPIAPAPSAAPVMPPAPPPANNSHKVRNIVLGVVGGLIVIGVIGSAFGSDDSGDTKTTGGAAATSDTPKSSSPSTDTPSTDAPSTDAPSTDAPSTTADDEPTKKPDPQGTTSQMQALGAAQDYLDYQSFSHDGLVGQLSSKYGDQFDKADAVWAVNHLDVNWNKQAVQAAKDYLEFQHFSRDGLIDQLSSKYGDQFTKAQATYAANHIGL